MSYYQRNKDKILAYQKEYNLKNKEKYDSYQANYYLIHRDEEWYKKKSKEAKQRYDEKNNKEKILKRKEKQRITKEQKLQKKQEVLKRKMLRELLRTVDEIKPYEPPPPPKQPDTLPFTGIFVNHRGFFALKW